MLSQYVPEGLHPMGRTHAGAVCGELQPGRKTHVGVVYEGLYPVGHHAGVGEECEEEGSAEKIYDEVDTSPFPSPLCHLCRRARSKVQPGKKRSGGKVILAAFISHYPTLPLTGSKLN